MKQAVRAFSLLALLLPAPLWMSRPTPLAAQGVSSGPTAAGLVPPDNLRASDTPNDAGTGIDLAWELADAARQAELTLWRTESDESGLTQVASLPPGTTATQDLQLERGRTYRYLLRASLDGSVAETPLTPPVVPHLNLFNRDRLNALLLFILFCTLVLSFISSARSGRKLFIRRIAGLNALDEAIGRATEMGRKIFYLPGIMSMDEIQTVASMAVLKYVAKSAANYQADLEVPNKDPITFAAARETVKEAYLEAGRPDLYREEMVHYVTYDQFAYTATISGRMVRERPAANLLIGAFYAESLLLAETGQACGAIQIAGTAEVPQLPFFVCACDYTLIGEELYAASAYLSRDPVILGSIKGQDYTKLVVIVVALVGILLESLGVHGLADFLTAR